MKGLLVAFVVIYCVIAGATQSDSGDAHVTLYEDLQHKGASHYMRLGECENIPSWLNDKASSLNTHGGRCVSVCEHADCEGRCIELTPGSAGHHDLRILNMDDSITSVKPC